MNINDCRRLPSIRRVDRYSIKRTFPRNQVLLNSLWMLYPCAKKGLGPLAGVFFRMYNDVWKYKGGNEIKGNTLFIRKSWASRKLKVISNVYTLLTQRNVEIAMNQIARKVYWPDGTSLIKDNVEQREKIANLKPGILKRVSLC